VTALALQQATIIVEAALRKARSAYASCSNTRSSTSYAALRAGLIIRSGAGKAGTSAPC